MRLQMKNTALIVNGAQQFPQSIVLLLHNLSHSCCAHKPYVLNLSDISISVYLTFPDGFKCTEHLNFHWETGALYFKMAPDLIIIFLLKNESPSLFHNFEKILKIKNWHLKLANLIWFNCLNVKKNQLLTLYCQKYWVAPF